MLSVWYIFYVGYNCVLTLILSFSLHCFCYISFKLSIQKIYKNNKKKVNKKIGYFCFVFIIQMRQDIKL